MEQRSNFFTFLRKIKFFIILPLIPLVVVPFLYPLKRQFFLFPSSEHRYTFNTYGDGGEGGNTVISEPQVVGDSCILFSYTMKKVAPYPYAGLSFELMVDSIFLDLSEYDRMTIRLESENIESFTIYIKAFIDGFTELDQQFTQEFLMKEVTAESETSLYTIRFNEFIHPSWWLEQSKIAEPEIGKPHFSQVISLQIQNGLLTPFYTPVYVSIKEVSFVKDNTGIYEVLIGSIFLYYLLYLIVFKLAQAKILGKKVVIPYKELSVENDADEDMKRIVNCVARNFSDPGFTVEKLAREAGVSASKIPGMLKERYDLNFKQYLNTIRITEAKRLLRETDNQIVTLAYTVGYNNIPHFNRTFKQFEGMSPKEYRKKNRVDA